MHQVLPFNKLSYQFKVDNNLFVVKTSRVFSFEDLIVHVGNLMADKAYYVGINALYDFSQLDVIEGSVDTFKATAEAMNDHNIIHTAAKTAILVDDNASDIQKIFQDYVEMTTPSLIEYRVFTLSERQNMLHFLDIDESVLV